MMMNDCMGDSGWMMAMMGTFWLLSIGLMALAAAALLKYIRRK